MLLCPGHEIVHLTQPPEWYLRIKIEIHILSKMGLITIYQTAVKQAENETFFNDTFLMIHFSPRLYLYCMRTDHAYCA